MKAVSLNELREHPASRSVWALNTTSSSPTMQRNIDPETGKWKQERAVVVLQVNSASSNEREVVVIPQSFLPVDVTEYAPLHDLLECSAFRKSIREGLITIIDEDSADELFNTPGADVERKRLREQEMKIRKLSASRAVAKSEVINVSNPSENEHQPYSEVRPVHEIPRTEEDDYDPAFVANVLRWSQMDSISVLNEMRASGPFSRRELNYAISKLDPVKQRDVVEHIKSKIAAKKRKVMK